MTEYVENVPQYEDDQKDTGMAALAHILGLLTGLFGPLIMYLLADDEFVKKNSAKAFTWQLFAILYTILAMFMISFVIGFLLLPVIFLLNTLFCIIGAVKASDGEVWKYPGTVDLLESSEKTQHTRNQEQTRDQTDQRYQDPNRRKRRKPKTEEELKQMYLDGEISDEEFEERLDEIQEENQKEFDRSFN